MAKKITVANRVNIGLVLLAVILLILWTNRVDQNHFDTAQEAMTSVYNDRVVSQNYIYKINNLIHEKECLNAEGAESDEINEKIDDLITDFSKTKLTQRETVYFNSLISNIEKYRKSKAGLIQNVNQIAKVNTQNNEDLNTYFIEIRKNLDDLAAVQLSVSRNIKGRVQKSFDINKTMADFETGVLLVLGVIILIVTFYRLEKSKAFQEED
ncbi:hypothetical protein BST97_03930 [Nonlabens spongiae]|uniref:Chemotaxis methyl-accepting receptor HlyB-like 4HB MCP domain-containing protein n=1 Tax=Nonlabens spongiae TaxID=331648 RepID=A0A1W6MIB0_9FLAO|nr:MCP four helix bundle domain-containing protein [Nonlabens spongiae]ARN77199.1 hypothetical protein BST97_03930 [Nonlabens spongiae]